MKLTVMKVVNAFTDIDDMIQFDAPQLKALTPTQLIEIGQFYQIAKQLTDSLGDNGDINEMADTEIEIPGYLGWIESWLQAKYEL